MGRARPAHLKKRLRERAPSVQGEVASPQEEKPHEPPSTSTPQPTQSAMADDHAAAADLVDGGRPEVIPSAPSSLVCLSCEGEFPSRCRALGGREALRWLSIDLCVARAVAREGP